MNNIKYIRKQTSMNQRQFAEYFHISLYTLQEWEQGRRTPPPYVSEMMERILKLEGEI